MTRRPAAIAILGYGGVHHALIGSLMRSLPPPDGIYADGWHCLLRSDCAAVDHVRSSLAEQYLRESAHDVLVTVDHDISWAPGDLRKLVDAAHETGGIVAALVSKRCRGRGWGSRLPPGEWEIGADELVELPAGHWAGGALWAIHRDVIEALVAASSHVRSGFAPIFAPMLVEGADGETDYLTEDWAFCERARRAGYRVCVHLGTTAIHHDGATPYTPWDGVPL